MSDTQSQENIITDTSDIDHTSASAGELLLRQREQLGVPLADAARALNLRPAVVSGLERDDYQEIPVAAYRRGYLRAYAKYLGMDDRLVLEAYQARNGTVDAERKVTPVSTAARPPSKIGAWLFKLVTLLVIVGLIAVTVMWWQSRGGNEPPGFGSSPTEETATAPAQPANDEPMAEDGMASPGFTTAGQNGNQNGGSSLISDAANISPTPEPTQPSASSYVSDTDSPAIAESTDEPQTAAVEEEAPASEEAEATVNDQAVSNNIIELTFNEQSWTEIFDATNQRVFVGLQTPGTTTTVEGQPPFRLTVGNATGVELRYQGELVDLPARAGANNVARFTLGE